MPTILQKQIKLRPEFILETRNSKHIRALLLLYFDISASTLSLWLDHNNNNFTQIGCLEILKHHFDCESVNDLLNTNPKNVVLKIEYL